MKITTAQYAKSLYEATAEKSEQEVAGVVKNFLQVVIRNRQKKMLPKILEKFSEIWNKNNSTVDAEVTSKFKLDGEQILKIEKFIKEKYAAQNVNLKKTLDEKVMGGIIVKVENEITDISLAGRLMSLKNRLSK
jgi:F-type H+-transporting ATPase subunit delta